jgi:hypothetical protein
MPATSLIHARSLSDARTGQVTLPSWPLHNDTTNTRHMPSFDQHFLYSGGKAWASLAHLEPKLNVATPWMAMGYNTLALVAYAAIMHSSATSDTLNTHTHTHTKSWGGVGGINKWATPRESLRVTRVAHDTPNGYINIVAWHDTMPISQCFGSPPLHEPSPIENTINLAIHLYFLVWIRHGHRRVMSAW